ncbi:MAG TPA: hypothetical protein VIG88_00490, partial [Lysobacter sp.]
RAPRDTSRAAEPRQHAPASLPAHLDAVAKVDDTFETLRARYGESAIRRARLPAGEGGEYEGWILFPADPSRRIDVALDEAGVHPATLGVDAPSAWRRADGVRIGMYLRELQALNGRPFEFAGFGWDYGGTVTDWKGGALGRGGPVPARVRLCAPDEVPSGYPTGDGAFMSDLPAVQSHPPVVCRFDAVPRR